MANEKVMKVTCINSSGFPKLKTLEDYYVCEANADSYYVSIFPSAIKSHMGTFPKRLFTAGVEIKTRNAETATAAAAAKQKEEQQMSLF